MALNNLTRITNSGFGTDTSINTTGIVTATAFSGDGSALTGVVGSGSGVVIREEGTNVGTAQTINFVGTGVTATISGAVATIEITSGSGGGGGGISDVVSDTSPQLGGNLDLNSNNITGTGDIDITGDATFSGDLDVDGHVDLDNVSIAGVSTFSGTTEVKNTSFRVTNSSASGQYLEITQNNNSSLTLDKVGDGAFYIRGNNIYLQNDGSSETYAGFEANGRSYLNYDASTKFETTSTGAIVTGTLVATATTATNVTVADESTDTSCFLLYSTEATGNVSPKTGSNLTFNSSSGTLSAGSFVGDGSGLTGITASGSGVVIRDDGSLVGTAGTIDFGSNVSVSPISAGVVTVTADAGTIAGINTSATTELNHLTATGIVTANSFVKSGGTSSQFLKADGTVDSSTYLTSYTETDPVVAAINGIVKSNGSTISAATAGTDYLTPTGDGSGLTGIGTAFTNVQATWSVGGDTSGYTFTGPGQDGAEQNPDIYLVRGQRYRFINTTGSSHPFRIQSDTSGTAYTDGVSGSQSGTQEFNVQHDAPSRLFYQCTIHSGMIGNIYVVGGSDWRMTDVNTSTDPEIYTDRYVGIGTDNPDEKFEVYGGKIKVDGGGNRWITIDPGSNTTYEPRVEGSHELVFRSYVASGSGVKTCTFTSNGDLDLTQGRNLKFASGNGIDFSATGGPDTGTGSSELLDDYEEGTYSPAWQHATNVNYTSQNGQYIKIGRLVRVSGEFSFTTYTSFPNGWDQITLPFNGTRLNSSGSLSSDWWGVVAGGTGQSAGTLNFGPFGNPHNDTNLAFTNIFLTGNNGLGNANLGAIFTSSSTTKTIRFHITYTATS